jgi:hypothetical protein
MSRLSSPRIHSRSARLVHSQNTPGCRFHAEPIFVFSAQKRSRRRHCADAVTCALEIGSIPPPEQSPTRGYRQLAKRLRARVYFTYTSLELRGLLLLSSLSRCAARVNNKEPHVSCSMTRATSPRLCTNNHYHCAQKTKHTKKRMSKKIYEEIIL